MLLTGNCAPPAQSQAWRTGCTMRWPSPLLLPTVTSGCLRELSNSRRSLSRYSWSEFKQSHAATPCMDTAWSTPSTLPWSRQLSTQRVVWAGSGGTQAHCHCTADMGQHTCFCGTQQATSWCTSAQLCSRQGKVNLSALAGTTQHWPLRHGALLGSLLPARINVPLLFCSRMGGNVLTVLPTRVMVTPHLWYSACNGFQSRHTGKG